MSGENTIFLRKVQSFGQNSVKKNIVMQRFRMSALNSKVFTSVSSSTAAAISVRLSIYSSFLKAIVVEPPKYFTGQILHIFVTILSIRICHSKGNIDKGSKNSEVEM